MGIEIIKDFFSDSRQITFQQQIIPLRRKLAFTITAFTVLIVIILGILQDRLLSQVLKEDHQTQRNQIEEATIDAIGYYDNLNLLIAKTKESRIKHVLDRVLADYQNGTTAGSLKLSSYIDKNIENLYLIDSNNKIMHSTDPTEIGLDFRKFPEFSRQLDDIRSKGVLFIDGISIPATQKQLKLFAYLPTPDKKLIIEYGINISDIAKDIDTPDLAILIRDIKKNNPIVDSLNILRADGSPFLTNPADNELRQKSQYITLLKEAIRSGKKQIKDENSPIGTKTIIHIPIYMKSGQSEFGKTNVIELILNDGKLLDHLKANLKSIITVIAICILFSILISYQLARYVSRPVEALNSAMKNVGEGDFRPVSTTNTNDEFMLLNLQFNAMVLSIKALINENFSKKIEIENMYKELQTNYAATVEALANAIEAKDTYTKGHCERVTSYCLDIGLAMRINSEGLQNLRFAALLHDIGKIGVSGKLLNKEGSLTDDEQIIIGKHPDIGCNILEGIYFLEKSRIIIMQHHERPDGSGYPQGLMGDQILLEAKILSVADAFDAMTTQRPYRKSALPLEEALSELKKYAGTYFDAAVVEAATPIFASRFPQLYPH